MHSVRKIGQVLLLASAAIATAQQSSLTERDFQTPPPAALPRAWWHWMSGNVTKEGITADLEWMHRVGIGGFQMFDADLGVLTYVDKPLIWMTPDWKTAFRHTGAEADRLGLEMTMAASGGWSETAGPWVTPPEAMKKVVWSETTVTSPKKSAIILPQPPNNNGPFQGISPLPETPPPTPGSIPGKNLHTAPNAPDSTYYADTVVLAYRLPKREASVSGYVAKITSSDPTMETSLIADGNYATGAYLNLHKDEPRGWVQWKFAKPFPARSLTIGMRPSKQRQDSMMPDGELSYSKDGVHWTRIALLPESTAGVSLFSVRTFAFAPIYARFFRLTMQQTITAEQKAHGVMPGHGFELAELELSASPRVQFYEDKASFGTFVTSQYAATPKVDKADAIPSGTVLNLTSKLRSDGTLDWDVPPGRWSILRMGYSLTGKKNHPATPAATGYEVDKLSKEHVLKYMQAYTSMISHAISPYYGKSFQYLLMDSWEAGQENWTENMIEEFQRRRGYDPTPYLPTLTGRVIDSAETSDAFLWDYRRTIAEMLAENHYQLATEFLQKQGLGLYAEAMGTGLPTTGDGLLNKGQATVPMGEFWTPAIDAPERPAHVADVLEAASAAHIYGKPIVATESFTSAPATQGWAQSPFYLKPLADQNFARGVNRIVFHTSDHQPFVDDKHKPGITLSHYGQHYSRNITWSEQAVAWNTYLARCSYMLQQGKPTADIAYFYGEGAPVTVPFWKDFSPAVPSSYLFDYVNSDILLHQTSIKAGKIALDSGMRYRVLVIPDEFTSLSLPLLRKLEELIRSGAVVLAPRVLGSPSLGDQSPQAIAEIKSLVDKIWGEAPATSGMHSYGQGRIYWKQSLQEVLTAERVQPDFTYDARITRGTYAYQLSKPSTDIAWTHRKDADTEIYFVANQQPRTEDLLTSYRISGKSVELWHPDTGITEPSSYHEESGRTVVMLHLNPEESVFVVFRGRGQEQRKLPQPTSTPMMTLDGPWDLRFQPNLGAPDEIEVPGLKSWSDFSDPGVKYFSGTATYSKDFTLEETALGGGGRFILDLGRVLEIAEVSVNGKAIPAILWKPPFAADITSTLQPGKNHLEIRVTNLWPNRLIGDKQPDAEKKYTFTIYEAYKADSPLMESGLIGPVRLLKELPPQE